MPWRFEVDGDVFRESDITLGQALEVEDFLDRQNQEAKLDAKPVSWSSLHPLGSARHAVAIASVCLAERRDISLDEATKIVRSLGAVKFIEDYAPVDDDMPKEWEGAFPPSADAQATST